MINKINNDINSLTPDFKKKVQLFFAEANKQWLYPVIFEALRTPARQAELYAQWRSKPWKIVTWTLKSNHFSWNAVDLVWKDSKWNISWNWPYEKLISIAKNFGIKSLYPDESAHFENNFLPLKTMEITNTTQPVKNKTKYTDFHDNLMKSTWFVPIFDNFENDQDIKELINIACARMYERSKGR